MSTAAVARARIISSIRDDRARARMPNKEVHRQDDKKKAGVHEATRHTRQRRMFQDAGSGDRIVGIDAKSLRDSARALCRDYDVARNGLNILVQNTVGSGIDVMPAPRRMGESVNRELAQILRDAWDEWWDLPEVTKQHDFGKCQQLIWSSACRDGEVFYQDVMGTVDTLRHGTSVPYSIEMLEADLVPLDLNIPAENVKQGVRRNGWGEVTGYHVYKNHPGDSFSLRMDTKFVPASSMHSVASIDRIHQVRGLSVFAPIVNRLRDIQDYENSERIAAKVAASFCAQIIKDVSLAPPSSGPGALDEAGAALDRVMRSFNMVPGMIGDDLEPGEKLEIIDSKRPNPNIAAYLDTQIRRAAGGIGVSFSSLSLNYNGTYSAQRQELVEKFGYYAMLGEFFVARFMRPIWKQFVLAAVLSGKVKIPKGWTLSDLQKAVFIRPQMPWIDPLKEILARGEQVDRGWMAPQQAILQSGNDPEEVQRLIADWNEMEPVVPATHNPNSADLAASARSSEFARASRGDDE